MDLYESAPESAKLTSTVQEEAMEKKWLNLYTEKMTYRFLKKCCEAERVKGQVSGLRKWQTLLSKHFIINKYSIELIIYEVC